MRHSELKSLIKEIVKVCLNETPESVIVTDKDENKNRYLTYNSKYHVGTFMIININNKDEYFLIRPDVARVFCSEKMYKELLDRNINDQNFLRQNEISDIVQEPFHYKIAKLVYKTLKDTAKFQPTFIADRDNQDGIAGRIFYYKDQYYCSFWQKTDKIKPRHSLLEKLFKEVYNTSLKNVLWEPAEYWNKLLTAEEVFGSAEISTEPTTDDLTIQQKHELHLNPQLKRKVLKLPPQQLKKVADKINMPMAQFRQYMGMAAAEEE